MQRPIHKRIQKPAHRPDRRGATLVETAICLLTFLTLMLGMLDLGLIVARYNTVSEAARLGARIAIVRGSKAAVLTVADGKSVVDLIHDRIDPLLRAQGVKGTITVAVAYTDRSPADRGDSNTTTNDPAVTTAGDTVTVTVGVTYTPVMKFIFGSTGYPKTLTGRSTMGIAH